MQPVALRLAAQLSALRVSQQDRAMCWWPTCRREWRPFTFTLAGPSAGAPMHDLSVSAAAVAVGLAASDICR